MKAKEIVAARADWRFVVRRADTEEVVKEIVRKNVLTTVSKNFFAEAYGGLFGNTGYGRYNWCLMLGTGSGTPSETDTGLFNAVPSTAKKGSITVSNNTVQFYVRYMPEEANGYTYTEAGIYDHIAKWVDFDPTTDYSQGQLINHVLIEPAITKDSSILLDVYVTITFP